MDSCTKTTSCFRFSRIFIFICTFCALLSFAIAADSYYSLLGIEKDASSREIRKAFKKLALELHPDKNKDDAEVHDKFLKINRAYETLKDEESRRKYDLFGEESASSQGQRHSGHRYQSWDYYQQNFGIYDDDPEIFTLSSSDFERFVSNAPNYWFINFYSPMCSHCHRLAPVWRAVARELNGVIRIGAVNCEEEWALCRRQGIGSYPSLILYPNSEKFYGDRETADLVDYVLRMIPSKLIFIHHESDLRGLLRDAKRNKLPHLAFICGKTLEGVDRASCPSMNTRRKLTAMLDNLVNVLVLDANVAPKTIEELYDGDDSVVFFQRGKLEQKFAQVIQSFDAQEIYRRVLQLLPEVVSMDHESLAQATESLYAKQNMVWGIAFTSGADHVSDVDLELKKLPFLLSQISKVDCDLHHAICDRYHVRKYPSFAILKSGGRHEFYHDRLNAMDIASFLKESILSSVETLTPSVFSQRIVQSGETWFVDFFAPWCPPCLQLLPEWRKASRSFESSVRFGTVDCTIHQSLCSQYNVRSYPTTVLFNGSVRHHYTGRKSSDDIVEFVQDMLSPSVVVLNAANFDDLVTNRSPQQLWAVDFFAPWCGPCQQLAPQWRKMAKMLASLVNVNVGLVDCTDQAYLCNSQGVHSYPTLRIFPMASTSRITFHDYSDWNRDAASLAAWVRQFLPGSVVELDNNDFYNHVVYGTEPWIVDFYAPWCGHCHAFAPEFEIIADILSGKVKAGKVNCERTRYVCQQAGIRAYPTIKFYPGAISRDQQQDILGETIANHGRDVILAYIESRLIERQVPARSEHDEL